jgi:hypothetical protein
MGALHQKSDQQCNHYTPHIPDTYVLVLVCQLNSSGVVVGINTGCSVTKVVLRAALRRQIVVVAAVLGDLIEINLLMLCC